MEPSKDKRFEIRLSQKDYEQLKIKAVPFDSVANYIRRAIAEFSDTDAKRKLDNNTKLFALFKDVDAKLAHAGGNLNQAMQRCNSLAAVDRLSYYDLKRNLEPSVSELYREIKDLREKLKAITIDTIS